MSNILQEFLAAMTQTNKNDLVAAFLHLPEDKRNWSPSEKSRSSADLIAECALNNGVTAEMIKARKWPAHDQEAYMKEKAELANGDWNTLHELLDTNTDAVIATIKVVPDSELSDPIQTPYGGGPLSGICAYPYWNMSYHLGQINYIHTILGI
jgi:hypothetical protein